MRILPQASCQDEAEAFEVIECKWDSSSDYSSATIASVIFSAFIHRLDHICTVCSQSEEFSLLREFELSGTLRTAPLKHGRFIR